MVGSALPIFSSDPVLFLMEKVNFCQRDCNFYFVASCLCFECVNIIMRIQVHDHLGLHLDRSGARGKNIKKIFLTDFLQFFENCYGKYREIKKTTAKRFLFIKRTKSLLLLFTLTFPSGRYCNELTSISVFSSSWIRIRILNLRRYGSKRPRP